MLTGDRADPAGGMATQDLFDDLAVLSTNEYGAHRQSLEAHEPQSFASLFAGAAGRKEAASSRGSEELLVVSLNGASCRIRAVGARWAKVLGFTPSELVGRSLSLVTGPGTDMAATMEMLRGAKPHEGPEQRVTLHHKSGDGVQVYVAAASVSEVAVLVRLAGMGSHDAGATETRDATFLADAPYRVCSSSAALRELYQCSDCTLQHEGIACLFGWRTDGKRWKNMVQRAQGGATTSASLFTYQACGNEMQTILTVSPFPEHAARLRLMVELVKSSPACGAADSRADSASERLSAEAMEQLLARWGPSSNSSTSSDRSTSDSTSRTEDSPEPQHPDPSANVDTALSVHLRAMKARRESKKKERKIALSRASSE